MRQDEYLDNGFFRAGHTVQKTRFIFFENKLWSTVWSRVPLETYTLSKRQRKLWNRANKRFSYTVQPYQDLEDQHQVYHIYQQNHALKVGETLDEIFGRHDPAFDFNTYSVRFYSESGELAGFSLFDLGDESIASLMGCYLPAYAKYSLGFFSMLAEMDYGKSQGIKYYHPGYCVPGLPAFEYKLKLPDLEGKSYVQKDWSPIQEVISEPLPNVIIEQNIETLHQALNDENLVNQIVYTPLFEVLPIMEYLYGPYPHPVMIKLENETAIGSVYIGYSVQNERFEVFVGNVVTDLSDEEGLADFINNIPVNSDLKIFSDRRLMISSIDAHALAYRLKNDLDLFIETIQNMDLEAE